ncbi:hypothetical protein [Kocuria rosea]|uniref:hypothetical protein n=1 Tax=Kocuria rosea TaxID=1275 RepID=UPI000F716F99|nr:hypothetical protein [Kocuria rosea]VEI51265.1 Uncharacterised protein [Kocuria rosea]
MSIEDERRTRAAARAAHEPQPRRRTPHDRGAREAGLERALDEVRKVGIEASELLRREGLKPAKLVHVPRGARSYPLVGHAFSRVACGYGWHVIRGLVVGTDGRLWTRSPLHDPTPQKDLDAWRLNVEPPGGRGELPHPVQYDGTSLHTVRRLSEQEYLKVDLIDHLTDGYARLLVLHHRRRS